MRNNINDEDILEYLQINGAQSMRELSQAFRVARQVMGRHIYRLLDLHAISEIEVVSRVIVDSRKMMIKKVKIKHYALNIPNIRRKKSSASHFSFL